LASGSQTLIHVQTVSTALQAKAYDGFYSGSAGDYEMKMKLNMNMNSMKIHTIGFTNPPGKYRLLAVVAQSCAVLRNAGSPFLGVATLAHLSVTLGHARRQQTARHWSL